MAECQDVWHSFAQRGERAAHGEAALPSSIEPDQGGAGHVPPSAQLLRQFEDKLTQEQLDRRLPTLCVALARDGVLAWWGSRGTTGIADSAQPTAATQYRIGSITKTFVAVSVMRLRDEGVLDLSDGIGEHVRELAELPVTIAQLMSHTSGLRAETPAPWWERTPGMSFTELVAACARARGPAVPTGPPFPLLKRRLRRPWRARCPQAVSSIG